MTNARQEWERARSLGGVRGVTLTGYVEALDAVAFAARALAEAPEEDERAAYLRRWQEEVAAEEEASCAS